MAWKRLSKEDRQISEEMENELKEFAKWCKLQPLSVMNYVATMRMFFRDYDINSIKDINNDNLYEFLSEGMGKKRVYARKYAVKKFISYLKFKNKIPKDAFVEVLNNIKYKLRDRKYLGTLNDEEVNMIVTKIKRPELKVFLQILFDTGARVRAVLLLKKSNIKIINGYPYLFLREKGEKHDKFLITKETYRNLMNYANTIKFEYIFLNSNVAKVSLVNKKYYKMWTYLKNETRNMLKTYGVSFHFFRRAAANHIYKESGYNLVVAQSFLRHQSPDTTIRYLKIQSRELDKILKKEKRKW